MIGEHARLGRTFTGHHQHNKRYETQAKSVLFLVVDRQCIQLRYRCYSLVFLTGIDTPQRNFWATFRRLCNTTTKSGCILCSYLTPAVNLSRVGGIPLTRSCRTTNSLIAEFTARPYPSSSISDRLRHRLVAPATTAEKFGLRRRIRALHHRLGLQVAGKIGRIMWLST